MVRFFLEQYTAEGECDNFLYFLKQYTQWQQQIAVRSQAAMSDLAPTIYNSEVVVQTLAKQAFEQWQDKRAEMTDFPVFRSQVGQEKV